MLFWVRTESKVSPGLKPPGSKSPGSLQDFLTWLSCGKPQCISWFCKITHLCQQNPPVYIKLAIAWFWVKMHWTFWNQASPDGRRPGSGPTCLPQAQNERGWNRYRGKLNPFLSKSNCHAFQRPENDNVKLVMDLQFYPGAAFFDLWGGYGALHRVFEGIFENQCVLVFRT